jgi:hypothetical protein
MLDLPVPKIVALVHLSEEYLASKLAGGLSNKRETSQQLNLGE